MAAVAERGTALLSSDQAEKETKAQISGSCTEQHDVVDIEGEGDEVCGEELNAAEP